MRELQAGFVDDLIAEQHEIQIKCSRCAGVRAFAAVLAFDAEKHIEQLARGEGRLAGEDSVQIQRLRLGTDPFGLCFNEMGERRIGDDGGKAVGGEGDGCATIPEIAANGNRNPHP